MNHRVDTLMVSRSICLPIVEVLRRRGSRPVEPPSAPLPPAVVTALGSIVRDMRDVPRDCLRDPAELVMWLRRMAGRVEGVGRIRVAEPPRVVRRPSLAAPAPPRALTVRQQAEAVFGNAPKPCSKPVERRTVTSGRGRAVSVEIRRARAGGQMELRL